MMPLRSLLLRIAPLLFMAPCFGQTVPKDAELLWPTDPSYGTGSFVNSRMAFMTGGRHPHALIGRGSKAVLMYEIAAYESLTPLGVNVLDFDVMPGGGISPEHDSVIVATSNGLKEVWVDGDPDSFQSALLSGNTWNGSLIVRCADLDGDVNNTTDLAGVDSTGTVVWTKLQDGSGGWIDGSFVPGWPVLAMELIRYFPGGPHVIALSTTDGLKIVDRDGLPIIDYRSIDSQSDLLAVLRGPNYDQLAWFTLGAASNLLLLIVDDTGIQAPVYVNQWGVVAAASGDADNDGDQDLFLAQDTDHLVPCLLNQDRSPTIANPTGSFSTDPAAYELLDPGNQGLPIPGNQAMPLPADYDSDGDLDLAYPTTTLNRVVLFEGPLISGGSEDDGTEYGTSGLPNDFDRASVTDVTFPNGDCSQVDIGMDVYYQDYGECTNPNRFQVVCWLTPDYQLDFDPHKPEHHKLYPCDGTSDSQRIHFRFGLPDADWDSTPLLVYVYVRPIELVGEEVRSAGPPIIGGFALDDDALAQILVHPAWWQQGEMKINLNPNLCFAGPGSRYGGFFRSRFAVLPNGLIPDPGDAE